jgi:hypothetical protein
MAAAARMPISTAEPVEDEAFGRRLNRMLEATDAQPGRPVCIAGPGSLDLMCALWRRGFERVESVRACTCGCADERCDLLVVAGDSAANLADTITATSRLLAPGGRIAVMSSTLKSVQERDRLCNLLANRGFRYRPGAPDPWLLLAAKPDADDLN